LLNGIVINRKYNFTSKTINLHIPGDKGSLVVRRLLSKWLSSCCEYYSWEWYHTWSSSTTSQFGGVGLERMIHRRLKHLKKTIWAWYKRLTGHCS